jgi:hypothetical protein
MYKNDSKYRIILEKHNVKSVSELIGDTSTKHTMHERHMNKILNAGGLHSNLPRFNQAVETATAEYKAIIERLIQESKDDPDVKKYNEKKSQKDTLTESLKKVSLTENQQDYFFEILKQKHAELEAELNKLAQLKAELAKLEEEELAKLAKLEEEEEAELNEKEGGSSPDNDWENAPIEPINLGTIPTKETQKETLNKKISESEAKISQLRQDISNIIQLTDEKVLKKLNEYKNQNDKRKVKSNSKP